MSKNASGFKCKMKTDWSGKYCNLHQDSYNNAQQLNYDDKDILRIVLGTKSFSISNLASSEFPICKRFKNLKELKINGNEEKNLDAKFLHQCRTITSFKLLNLNVQEISENFFMKNLQLEKIELNQINFVTLPENLFLNQSKLNFLSLSDTELTFLPPNIFKSLAELQILHLSHNSFKILNPAWFESLKNLRTLILTDNKLEDLPKNIFKPLKNLESLRLNENQLNIIHSDSFGIHSKLGFINLKWNKINAFDEKLIDNSKVNRIYMSENNCYDEDIEEKEEIKQNLKNCFINYRPRQDESILLPWNFTHQTSDYSCGIRKIPHLLVHGGNNTYHGEFPWNVVLKEYLGGTYCGGTIISKNAVVTAAHCMRDKKLYYIFSPSNFSIILGAYDLSKENEPDRVTVWAKAIHIHPDWNVNITIYEADIAILEIESDIKFSDFIQPICLPSPQSGVINPKEGIVAGFGITENKILANIAQKLLVPIVDFHTCIRNSPDHESLISARAICGGPRDGRGVCSGDSGSGLNTYEKNHYYLYGVVSVALTTNLNECNVDSYGIYTSVVDFYGWIMTGKRLGY